MYGLGALLFSALAYVIANQRATIAQLREQIDAQKQNLSEFELLRAEAEKARQFQNQEAEIQRLREDNKDLLRLRNEVRQLREQIAQAEVLRSANAGLLEVLQGRTNLTVNQSALVVAARKQGAVLGIQTAVTNTAAYQGAQIIGFLQGAPAATSGLKVGDVIFRIDNRPVENTGQLQAEMLTRKLGEIVTLDVMRGNEAVRVQVKTMAWPQ